MAAFPASTTVLDSLLFRDAFGTPAIREVFSDVRLISRYAEIEVALARAEARCGVIPAEAAEEIAKRTNVSALDFDLLRQETDIVGYPILPLVHQMTRQCGEAGRPCSPSSRRLSMTPSLIGPSPTRAAATPALSTPVRKRSRHSV